MALDEPGLRRSLNIWETAFGGVGMILGAGIYALIGAATAKAGSGVWLSFFLAAGIAALAGLCYAELASTFPKAGADFEYALRAFGPRPAFLVGWSMAAGNILAAATVSTAFASYLGEFVSLNGTVAAIGLLLVTTVIASAGIKESLRVALTATAVEIGGLVFIIAIGVPSLPDVDFTRLDHGVTGVLAGSSLVMFAFNGFAQIATLSEEAEDAEHVVPRAMLLAIGITAVLYVAVALSALAVLGPAQLGLTIRPLTDVASEVLGSDAGRMIALIALFSTANTVLLHLIVGSRLIYGMALRGALPVSLSWIQPAAQTPVLAILLSAIVGVLFALSGELSFLAGATDFAILVGIGSVCASLIVLRRKLPDVPRPFRVPLSVGWLPVLPVAGLALTFVLLVTLEADVLIVGALLLVCGVAVMVARRDQPSTVEVVSDL